MTNEEAAKQQQLEARIAHLEQEKKDSRAGQWVLVVICLGVGILIAGWRSYNARHPKPSTTPMPLQWQFQPAQDGSRGVVLQIKNTSGESFFCHATVTEPRGDKILPKVRVNWQIALGPYEQRKYLRFEPHPLFQSDPGYQPTLWLRSEVS